MTPNTYSYILDLLEREKNKAHEEFVRSSHLLGVQEIRNGRIYSKSHSEIDARASKTLYKNYLLWYEFYSNMQEELRAIFK